MNGKTFAFLYYKSEVHSFNAIQLEISYCGRKVLWFCVNVLIDSYIEMLDVFVSEIKVELSEFYVNKFLL